MTAPRLSIIVPVHNGETAIADCLRAIGKPEGVEVIVVDDGSTDGTAAAARDLCHRLISLPENRGAAAARNRGTKEAAADLLLFVDADVVLEPDAVQRVIDLFAARPEAAAAVGRYTDLPAAPGFVNLYHNHFTVYHHDLSPPEIDWFWGAIGAVRKADFVKAGGFDERYLGASAEDMEFGKALAATGARIVYEPAIRGAHGHPFTLTGMLKNDYRKAVLGTKLRLGGRLPKKAPGFAGARNLASIALLLGSIAAVFTPFPEVYFLLLVALVIINAPFYRRFNRLTKKVYGGGGFHIGLHWIQLLVIFAGALAGAAGFVLGRDTFGRPGWI